VSREGRDVGEEFGRTLKSSFATFAAFARHFFKRRCLEFGCSVK